MSIPTLLALPENKIAKRVARFVNRRFLGNVSAAAEAMGCSYNRLWKLVGGDYRRTPPLDLLTQIAAFSGKPINYWIGVGFPPEEEKDE